MFYFVVLRKIVDKVFIKEDFVWISILKYFYFRKVILEGFILDYFINIYIIRSYLVWRFFEV